MALFFADLVREASWGTGAGDLPLGGALPGHRRFADAAPPGARFHYCIAGVTHPDEWETGEGEIGSADTLIRLPLASSAGGAAVAFSPGLKTVALTVNADWFATREEDGAVDAEALAEALAAKADLTGAAFAGSVAAPDLDLGTPLGIASGGTGAADAATARSALGLVIGTDVQAQNARLADIAANLSATSGAIEKTGANSFGVFTVSAFGKSMIDDADAGAVRTTLGLGSLATMSGINDGNWSGTDLAVANGGTGASDASGARLALAAIGYVSNALSISAAPSSTWDGASVAHLGLTANTTGSSNFPNTFGFTWSFKGEGTAPNQRSFDLFKAATNSLALYARGYNGSGVAQAWQQLWHDGSPSAADKRTAMGAAPLDAPNFSGTAQYGGLEIGYRDIPRVTGGLERGKCFAASSGVAINTGAAAGSACTIYNDSGSAITLTQGSGLTLRLGGTGTTGNRTLAARGFATIWYNSATEAIVSGAGVS